MSTPAKPVMPTIFKAAMHDDIDMLIAYISERRVNINDQYVSQGIDEQEKINHAKYIDFLVALGIWGGIVIAFPPSAIIGVSIQSGLGIAFYKEAGEIAEKSREIYRNKKINGWTALHFAAEQGAVAAAVVLILFGAKRDILSTDRKTYIDIAKENEKNNFVIVCEMVGEFYDERLKQKNDLENERKISGKERLKTVQLAILFGERWNKLVTNIKRCYPNFPIEELIKLEDSESLSARPNMLVPAQQSSARPACNIAFFPSSSAAAFSGSSGAAMEVSGSSVAAAISCSSAAAAVSGSSSAEAISSSAAAATMSKGQH
ncbi:MAG: hypothetical protein M1561_07570 [Gammaproteobacteria bacterium]|nr:hypothetical protein [Gammaproteobacteria bacterium]